MLVQGRTQAFCDTVVPDRDLCYVPFIFAATLVASCTVRFIYRHISNLMLLQLMLGLRLFVIQCCHTGICIIPPFFVWPHIQLVKFMPFATCIVVTYVTLFQVITWMFCDSSAMQGLMLFYLMLPQVQLAVLNAFCDLFSRYLSDLMLLQLISS